MVQESADISSAPVATLEISIGTIQQDESGAFRLDIEALDMLVERMQTVRQELAKIDAALQAGYSMSDPDAPLSGEDSVDEEIAGIHDAIVGATSNEVCVNAFPKFIRDKVKGGPL